MNDYARIAQVIELIDENYQEQPSLDELAARIGLSKHHFHRLFSEWAGVTPKTFLSYLTHYHARDLLAQGSSVLAAALDVGLSGPGRLHDLCVNLEAATPGEIKLGGAGWTIEYGIAESPFGKILIGENDRGICYLRFMDDDLEELDVSGLLKDWPNALLKRNDERAGELASLIFTSEQVGGVEVGVKQRAIKAYVKGTAMQVKVWRALLDVPAGYLTSYGELADSVGSPRAARAIGTAVGNNPLAYLIPCHRVIRKTGALGGYRWGLTRKRAILARESAPSNY